MADKERGEVELKSFDSSAMASSLFSNHSNQVTRSTSGTIYRSRSKAQMCLKKIIDVISSSSSLQPCQISKESSLNPQFDGLEPDAKISGPTKDLFSGKRGFDIDLNLRLGLPSEAEESENPTENRGFSACSGVGEADYQVCGVIVDCNSSVVSRDVSTVEKSSEGEYDPKDVGNSSGNDFPAIEENRDGEEPEVVEEETIEFSEIANMQVRSTEKRISKETEDGEESEIKAAEDREEMKLFGRRGYKSEGCLGLLVEAARLISGNFGDDEREPDEPSRSGSLRHEVSGEEIQKITETKTEMNESIGCRSKRNQCWMYDFYGGFEDISPVVRSKRGRNQVLPYKYRDSVLEPWKRLSRQRSTKVSSKPKPK